MAFDTKVDRSNADSRTARQIPESVASEIIKETVESSVAMQLGRTFRMPAYQHRIRVLRAFADAYWLGSGSDTQAVKDSTRKQTTSVLWDNVYLTTDELAVLVVVPDAWMDDSDIAWEEIRQELRRAFAKKIDQAVFFGAGSPPTSFGPAGGIYRAAVTAGNHIESTDYTDGTPYVDLADAIAGLAELMAEEGFDPDSAVTGPAFKWRLARLRDENNVPLLDRDFAGPTGQGLYGLNLGEVKNGAWDAAAAELILGDFSQLVIGVRQDITFAVSDSATIFNSSVADSYSAFQQDGKVLRATMRVGYVVPDPIKVLGGTYPFAAIKKTAGADS